MISLLPPDVSILSRSESVFIQKYDVQNLKSSLTFGKAGRHIGKPPLARYIASMLV